MTQSGQADEQQAERLERFNRRKRVVDLVLVTILLPIVLPLFVIIAVGLSIRQGRPVLYSQERLGFQEQVFKLYKFRTMTNARDDSGRLLPDQDRLTVVGTLLRRTSLDELPQMINVLRGDMSLVGPRPLFPRYQPFYTERERMRHMVRPGITGWAQVHGRNFAGWNKRFELDVYYVERASLWVDGLVLLKTLKRLIQRRDVAVVASTSGKPLDLERSYLFDKELYMRELRKDELSVRVSWMNDPSTRRYMRLAEEITLEATIAWFERNRGRPGRHDFVVVDRKTDEALAMTGLRQIRERTAESYIIVSPLRRGAGIGTRAQKLLLEWAFKSGLYDRVVSSVRRDNAASHQMHQKFGGRLESRADGRDEIIVTREDFMQVAKV